MNCSIERELQNSLLELGQYRYEETAAFVAQEMSQEMRLRGACAAAETCPGTLVRLYAVGIRYLKLAADLLAAGTHDEVPNDGDDGEQTDRTSD